MRETELRIAGRTIGALLLLQIAGGILGNFVLTTAAFAPPGFLVNAAPHALEMGLAVLVGLATAAIGLGIAIVAFPHVSERSQALARWLLALATVNLALAAVEQTTFLSLLSLSQSYAASAAPDEALYQGLRGVVAAARNWAHYVHLVIGGSALLVLFAALGRLALLPRALGAAGILAALLQMTGVAAPIFGRPVIFPLLAPLGLAMLVTAGWLLIHGIRQSRAAQPPAGD